MNCTNEVFNEDGETLGRCGENEGRLCEACETEIGKRILAEWLAAPMSERDPAQYATDMVDAGRGHLLTEDERLLARQAVTWNRIFERIGGKK